MSLGDLAALPGNRFAHIDAEQFRFTAGGIDEPEQNVHRGRFPGSIWPQKAEYLARFNPQVEVFDGDLVGLASAGSAVLDSQMV